MLTVRFHSLSLLQLNLGKKFFPNLLLFSNFETKSKDEMGVSCFPRDIDTIPQKLFVPILIPNSIITYIILFFQTTGIASNHSCCHNLSKYRAVIRWWLFVWIPAALKCYLPPVCACPWSWLISFSSCIDIAVSFLPILSWISKYFATHRSKHTDSPFVRSPSLYLGDIHFFWHATVNLKTNILHKWL